MKKKQKRQREPKFYCAYFHGECPFHKMNVPVVTEEMFDRVVENLSKKVTIHFQKASLASMPDDQPYVMFWGWALDRNSKAWVASMVLSPATSRTKEGKRIAEKTIRETLEWRCRPK